ncbi:MAG: hypothetical protein AAFY47_13195 [Pseudomonadota bacterium]
MMAQKITKGVWAPIKTYPLNDEDRCELNKVLQDGLTAEREEVVAKLRYVGEIYVEQFTKMPTVEEIEKHRVKLRERISDLLLALADNKPEYIYLNQSLRYVLPRFGALVSDHAQSAMALYEALRQPLEIERNTTVTRSGEAAGLRAVLWFLHEQIEQGGSRADWLGLAMGTGKGRGAKRLHRFLKVVLMRTVTSDQVRSAMDFLTSPKCDPPLGGGNKPSGFGGPLTDMPSVLE